MIYGSRLPLRLAALCLMATAVLGLASIQAGAAQHQAASAYAQGDYESAYRDYLKSAKKGDAYAQYRVSFMSALGLGTEVDPVESMAWAIVAEQSTGELLSDYLSALAALVPAKDRKKTQKKADYFLRRWGDDDSRDSGGGLARPSEGGCTGSRLRANCGASAGGGSYWISWGQDRSGDPKQRQVLQQIDQTLLEASVDWPGS